MYYAEKKLSRIGKSSLGVILPREWLFAMGLHKSGDAIRTSYDPRTRRIFIDTHPNGADALNFNALNSNGYNDQNDYTPQPRTQYPPSPHPKYTPAQWAKCDHFFKKQELEWLKEAEEAGVDITILSEFERFKQVKRDELDRRHYESAQRAQKRQGFFTFNDLPKSMLEFYWDDAAPHIGDYKGKPDLHNARADWLRAVNKSLELDTAEGKANFLRIVIEDIKKKYSITDDLIDDL